MTMLQWLIVLGAIVPFAVWLWWDIRSHRKPEKRRDARGVGTAGTALATAGVGVGVGAGVYAIYKVFDAMTAPAPAPVAAAKPAAKKAKKKA